MTPAPTPFDSLEQVLGITPVEEAPPEDLPTENEPRAVAGSEPQAGRAPDPG